MAVTRIDVKTQYDIGEVWSDASNETAARHEVQQWCNENSPWEIQSIEPTVGDDGRFRFRIVRVYRSGT